MSHKKKKKKLPIKVLPLSLLVHMIIEMLGLTILYFIRLQEDVWDDSALISAYESAIQSFLARNNEAEQ